MSNLRDDWMVLNGPLSEEGDPVLSCVFKTEFITHFMTATNGQAQLIIGPTTDYAKKKEKRAQIKFIKDETIQSPNSDVYKSHTVHVSTGGLPSSTSRPAAKRKAGIVRPITQGKLLRPGGPSSSANKPNAVVKPKSTAQALHLLQGLPPSSMLWPLPLQPQLQVRLLWAGPDVPKASIDPPPPAL